jgi:hypothetical protein
MQCPGCGAYANEDDLFCGECGRPLIKEAPIEEPLSPEEAKDLPTVGLERPATRPSPVTKKRASLVPALVLVAVGLLILGLVGGGLLFWVGSREITRATPTESGPRPGTLLYKESFGDATSGWDEFDEDDTWAGYVDGEYRVGVYRANYMAWGNPEPDQEFTGYQVEVDARQVEGPVDNNFGLLLRYQSDGDDFYWFQISADGYYSFDLRQDSEWTSLVDWVESDAIRQGLDATNRLKVICEGNQFRFYVNDVFLGEVADSSVSLGSIGLAAGAFDEPGVVIHFDDLSVYALEE